MHNVFGPVERQKDTNCMLDDHKTFTSFWLLANDQVKEEARDTNNISCA